MQSLPKDYKDPVGIDTHKYDGKIPNNDVYKYIKSRKGDIERVQKSLKHILTIKGIEKIPEINKVSISNFETIISSWGGSSNFDGTNDIFACDILNLICEEYIIIAQDHKDILVDFLRELFLQFIDMKTGLCPQGRTIRLWQVASMYFFVMK